jgi:hypothetical protein
MLLRIGSGRFLHLGSAEGQTFGPVERKLESYEIAMRKPPWFHGQSQRSDTNPGTIRDSWRIMQVVTPE